MYIPYIHAFIGILLGHNVTNNDLMHNQYDVYNSKANKQQILNYVSAHLS